MNKKCLTNVAELFWSVMLLLFYNFVFLLLLLLL